MKKNKPPVKKARIARSHLSYIPAAAELRDLILKMEGVTKVAAGIINQCGNSDRKRVKIAEVSGAILLKVRGSIAIQEVRVYVADRQKAKRAIEESARAAGFLVK